MFVLIIYIVNVNIASVIVFIWQPDLFTWDDLISLGYVILLAI